MELLVPISLSLLAAFNGGLMAKRLSDEEIQKYAYGKVVGDIDGIEAHDMFDDDDAPTATEGVPSTAQGVSIEIKPLMAAEKTKETDTQEQGRGSEEDEDKLKGISKFSPLMAALHKDR